LERTNPEVDGLIALALSLSKDSVVAEPTMEMNIDERRFVLTQYAPQALLSGCVLQDFANATNSHEPIASYVHGMHN
jgi:hypothetical protein